MSPNHTFILIVSANAAVCAAYRQEFEDGGNAIRILQAATLEEARLSAQSFPPAVIVFDVPGEAVLPPGNSPAQTANSLCLEEAATLLAGFAPVVLIAAPELQSIVAPLLSAGAADFVARAGSYLEVACGFIERRLREAARDAAARSQSPSLAISDFDEEEDFGEVLRHELNNPLTGILGNAELLLAEIRRRGDGRLPQGAQGRLETITGLAVRLREAVHRLSRQLDSRQAATRQT